LGQILEHFFICCFLEILWYNHSYNLISLFYFLQGAEGGNWQYERSFAALLDIEIKKKKFHLLIPISKSSFNPIQNIYE
jgi:hypothetical protein